jgi:DoxX-like protein
MKASKAQLIAGWIVSGLVAAFLGFSASGKFRDFPGKTEMFDHLGYLNDTMRFIGIIEVLVVILFLIPRTAFLGAILLTGYLGGATTTHLRVGDPYLFPIIIGVVAWVGYGLRRPDVIKGAFGPA